MTPEERTAVADLREGTNPTRRMIAPGLENLLHETFPVLDHGMLRVVDYMGGDEAIVQAARVSYGRGTKKTNEDRALIRYLMKNWHSTPFEMCEIKLHVKLPIFVARQWIRHRTASVNEYSARYSILDREFYIPEPEHLAAQSSTNRQGRGTVLQGVEAQRVLDILQHDANHAYDSYSEMLNEGSAETSADVNKQGLARELARMNLTLNFYTQWYWKTNLHNLMNFLKLRADPHAQYEIRAYAETMMRILQSWVPHTYDAFLEYRVNAVNLSGTAIGVIRRMISGEQVTEATSGLNSREWNELEVILQTARA